MAYTDPDECTGCGVCVDRCPFGARRLEENGLIYEPERCYGCGLCVTTCPTGAAVLAERGA
ncbi:MAG: 4Fe-4S binding protein [Thermodesulfobacteriota bacterium]